ncbi:conserved hypothetical protein, partial [Ricinus communis]
MDKVEQQAYVESYTLELDYDRKKRRINNVMPDKFCLYALINERYKLFKINKENESGGEVLNKQKEIGGNEVFNDITLFDIKTSRRGGEVGRNKEGIYAYDDIVDKNDGLCDIESDKSRDLDNSLEEEIIDGSGKRKRKK